MTRIEGFVVVENDDYYPVITWLTSSLSNWKTTQKRNKEIARQENKKKQRN